MQKSEFQNIVWLDPWMPVIDAVQDESRLRGCLPSHHPLQGKKVSAIGRRCDRKDYIYHVEEVPPRIALVRFRPDPDNSGPQTVFFTSVETWIEHCMKPEAEDFSS